MENKNQKALIEENKSNTEKLLNGLKSLAVHQKENQIKNLDKNKSIRISLNEFDLSLLNSGVIEKVTITPSTNLVSLNLTDNFILGVMGKADNLDYKGVKNKLEDVGELMAFNSIIRKEVKTNTSIFLNEIIVRSKEE